MPPTLYSWRQHSHIPMPITRSAQASAVTPQAQFHGPVRWQPATPDSVRDFSAACFYFARELQKTVDVPMGLVQAAWGGSRIEAWTRAAALRAGGGRDDSGPGNAGRDGGIRRAGAGRGAALALLYASQPPADALPCPHPRHLRLRLGSVVHEWLVQETGWGRRSSTPRGPLPHHRNSPPISP